jgi:hypothetical protein
MCLTKSDQRVAEEFQEAILPVKVAGKPGPAKLLPKFAMIADLEGAMSREQCLPEERHQIAQVMHVLESPVELAG